MSSLRKFIPLTIVLSLLFVFNAYAMNNNNEVTKTNMNSPENEIKNEDGVLNYGWVWINDNSCVRFRKLPDTKRTTVEERYNLGMMERWIEYKDGRYQAKARDIYSGTWLQSTDGTWSFIFDDLSTPVGVTKIDGVLYAFNGYGELKEGYTYYGDFKTGADGLVTAKSDEFNQWLSTQYLPECTSTVESKSAEITK